MHNSKKNIGNIISVFIILIMGSLFILHLINVKEFGVLEKGISTIFGSIYVLLIGVLFLLSYYFEEKSFLFKYFMWLCKVSTGSYGGKIAFFYFGLAILLGTMGLLYGFGILSQ